MPTVIGSEMRNATDLKVQRATYSKIWTATYSMMRNLKDSKASLGAAVSKV